MSDWKRTFSSKSLYRPLLIALAIALILLLFSLMFAEPLIAWFKNHVVITNEAEISNFVTTVSYSVEETASSSLSDGSPIRFDVPVDKSAVTINTSIGYQGESAAYLRVSFCGGYYNKKTGTYLPIDDGVNIVNVTAENWINGNDGYWYYPALLENYATATSLDTLTLKTNTDVYADMSLYQEYVGEIYVVVDAVQPNRIQELWGMAALPNAADASV